MKTQSQKIIALLGPTNTGKTHVAIEKMLEYDSGIFGLPLRLLAREVYDKCVQKVGIEKVALITGEEKIIPSVAQYFVCTVESMPKDKEVDFVAIDEIQMCADRERGHIFTERMLEARGLKLTMFLGSQVMAKIIDELIENVEFEKKDRYSKLSYSGIKKISRLDRKVAIIAFSIEEVYAIAELVRRQKGGAAVIMGSLSPKTRNSQVGLYQSGDVDYLIATDAIGMGLNMDINEIYFSNLKKFDGKKTRRLNLIEMSQIAGRAGRYKNDGGFGTTGDCETLNSDEIEKIEKHQLPDTKMIFWRNSKLNFENPERLISSLEQKPNQKNLLRTNDSLDESVLRFFLKKGANNIIYHKNLDLLWECCQIPDFEKKAYGQHINIIDKVFQFLTTRKRRIPSSFMKDQLKGLEKDHGNVDLLSHRLSNVRTWSYVANKKNWVENSDYWVQLTKSIEDKLSDKLHDELTKSFIDKKISILSRSLKQDLILDTKINNENKIHIDGQLIGELKGLKFLIEITSKTLDNDIKSIKKAARKGVEEELIKRVNEILLKGEININIENKILWKNNPIAWLKKGNDYLNPKIDIIADDALNLETKLKLETFLNKWLKNYVNEVLGDLIKLSKHKIENQYLRGLVFQLYESNGVIKRNEVDKIVKSIPSEERKKLWGMGIKIGRYHIYLPKMLKPRAVEFRISLWKLFHNLSDKNKIPQSGLNFLINNSFEKNF
ncbi:helicase-related protein, partial [Pelagibacteraceae bacterium]|nr:helicase-related protein [Pelagibacteraceae bacterium]